MNKEPQTHTSPAFNKGIDQKDASAILKQVFDADSAIDNGEREVVAVSRGVAKGKAIIAEYDFRRSSLLMIKQLMHLCRDVQKHRGLGMGLLAGNMEFSPRFQLLQQQMARRIDTLEVFSLKAPNPFSRSEAEKINAAWQTIRAGWHDDSVLENFQFHCHFVEQLLHMVMQLSHCLSSDTASQFPLAETDKNYKDELLVFVCQQLPRMIEFLGMVRALGTHSATLGHNIEEHDKKLKYFCQCVKTEKIQIIRIAEQLHQHIGADIPTLLVLRTYEYKVDAMINKIEKHIIGRAKIKIKSDDLFTMLTDIMDVYWRVVDDGIDLLHHYQDLALESWYVNGK